MWQVLDCKSNQGTDTSVCITTVWERAEPGTMRLAGGTGLPNSVAADSRGYDRMIHNPDNAPEDDNLTELDPIPDARRFSDATRVMIVDDQPIFREVARALLERDGDFAVVAEASDGSDAVIMVGEVHPDVVVMDVQMSAMDGIEATRRILADNPETSIVLTSMTAESEYSRLVSEIGALAFIAKRNLNPLSLRTVLGLAPRHSPMAA